MLLLLFHYECRPGDVLGFFEREYLNYEDEGQCRNETHSRNDKNYNMCREVHIFYLNRLRTVCLFGHRDEYYDQNDWEDYSYDWVKLWSRGTPAGQAPGHTENYRKNYYESSDSNAKDSPVWVLTIYGHCQECRHYKNTKMHMFEIFPPIWINI